MNTSVIVLLVGVVTFFAGFIISQIRNNIVNKKTKSASEDIIKQAKQTAEYITKEAKIEAKSDAKELLSKLQKNMENELKNRRNELNNLEKRLSKKEERIDTKMEGITAKENSFIQKEKKILIKDANIEKMKKEYEKRQEELVEELNSISNMTSEEAKTMIIENIKEQARLDATKLVKEIEEEAKSEAERKARSIIATSIQRLSSEYIGEISVSTVIIPNEEIKGRIIGKEGRNIRAFESITGVDLIVDDTPEVVTLSCFNPYRREIARITLGKLIQDGRVHPAKIEELFKKAKLELDKHVYEVGEKTIFELGLQGVHKDLIKLIGRLKYRTSYGQSVLEHSIEVASIAGHMASELGLTPKMAKRCGLLHDIGKAIDYEVEGSHTTLGVDICKKYKEDWRVSNAVLAHHNEEEYKCVEAVLVHAADILSASRPGARSEVVESYIKRMEKLEDITMAFDGVQRVFAIQAGREIRIIVDPDKINDQKMMLLSKDIANKIEEELTYPGKHKGYSFKGN